MINVIKLYSPIEKIIKLRKKYKFTQKDLVGDDLARSTLAMIETKKVNLTENVASIIVKNFNDKLIEKGIEARVDLQDIIEDKREQCNRIVNKIMTDLEKGVDFESVYHSLKLFFIREDFPHEKIRAYEYLCKKAKEKNDKVIEFDLHKDLVLTKIKVSLDFKDDLIYLLSTEPIFKRDIVELITLIEPFFEEDENPLEIYIALSNYFYQNNLYDLAMKFLKKTQNFKINDKNIESFLLEIKAKIYFNKGSYEDALRIYRKLSRVNDLLIKANVYLDFCILYMNREDQGDLDRIKRYFWKLRGLLDQFEGEIDFNDRYFHMAKVAEYLAFTKKAHSYYFDYILNGQDSFEEKYHSFEYVLNNSNLEDIAFIKKLESKFFELLEYNQNYLKLAFDFISFYKRFQFKELEDNLVDKIKNL